MTVAKQDTWFKIAANPKGIKAGSAHHWRCFLVPGDEVHTMASYTLTGQVSEENFIPQSTSELDVDPRAWILMYGDVEIDDQNIGTFVLKSAPDEQSA